MAEFLPPVVVELVASIKEFQAKMGEAKAELVEFEATSKSSFANFKKYALVGGAVAAAALVGAGVLIVKAYSEEENANAKLQVALKHTHQNTEEVRAKMEETALGMAKYGATSATATEALAKLTVATGNAEKAQKLLKVAADVSAFSHKDLGASATLVAKAAAGSDGALKRMGITLGDLGKFSNDASGKLAKGDAIIKALEGRIGGSANAASKTFSGSMQALGASVENTLAAIGKQLAPAIEWFTQKVAESVKWLQEHQQVMKTIAMVIGGILIAVIVAATVALVDMAVAWVAATWPILAVIAAIGLVVAAIVYLWNTNEGFRNAVMAVWNSIKAAVSSVVDNIKQKLAENQDKIDALKNGFSVFWSFLKDHVIPLLITFYSVYLQVLVKILGTVINIIVNVINIFINLVVAIVNAGVAVWNFAWAVGEAITKAVQFVIALPGKIVDALKSAGTWLVETGKNMIQGLLDGAGSLLSKIGQFFLDKLPSWIVAPFKMALGIHSPSKVFHQFGQDIIQGLVDGAAGGQGTVLKVFADLGQSVIDAFKATTQSAAATMMDQFSSAISRVNFGKGKNADRIKQEFSTLFDSLKGAVDDAESFGKQISDGIMGGLNVGTAMSDWQSKQDAVTSALKAVTDARAKISADSTEEEKRNLADLQGVYQKAQEDAATGGATIVDTFVNQAAKASEFANKLQVLISAGMRSEVWTQIAGLSAENGIKAADAFINGNMAENIQRANDAVKSTKTVAEMVATQAKVSYKQAGIDTVIEFMNKFIETVTSGKVKNQMMAAMDKLVAGLNRTVRVGVDSPALGVSDTANSTSSYVASPSAQTSYPGMSWSGFDTASYVQQAQAAANAPTNNITVNAQTNADADAIAKEIAWAMAVGVAL